MQMLGIPVETFKNWLLLNHKELVFRKKISPPGPFWWGRFFSESLRGTPPWACPPPWKRRRWKFLFTSDEMKLSTTNINQRRVTFYMLTAYYRTILDQLIIILIFSTLYYCVVLCLLLTYIGCCIKVLYRSFGFCTLILKQLHLDSLILITSLLITILLDSMWIAKVVF